MEPWGSAVCFFLLLFGVFAAMCCSGVLSGKIRSCLNDERQFLLSFRDASPRCSSDLWRNCCEWKGVECHRRQYHVIKLDLHSSGPGSVQRICNWKSPLNPKGVWGAGVLGLKHLKRLDVSSNNPHNAIPAGSFNGYLLQNMRDCYYRDQIQMITKRCVLMTCIDLSENQLTGDIPSQIGSLKGLRCLNISRNHITGQISEYGAIGVRGEPYHRTNL